MKAEEFNLESNIIDSDISYRGGSIKWDVSDMGWHIPEGEQAVMGTSQNYLGGGMAGAITNGYMFDAKALPDDQFMELRKLADRMKRYHYEQNGGGGDEYMVDEINTFERNQEMPVSAYGL